MSIIGGAIQGASNVLGASLSAVGNAVTAEQQRKHDKEMAAINQANVLEQMEKEQGYNLATMAQQNQYQLDQWNRENEYNDPSAVAQRYRAAGINPRAAFGQGSASGSGIAGGLSSAPSGGAPSGSSTGHSSSLPSWGNAFAGLGTGLSSALRVDSQNKTDAANATRAYEEAKSVYLANKKKEFEESNGAWLAELKSTKAKADIDFALAYMRKFDASLYEVEHTADVKKKHAEADNAIQIGKNLVATYDKILSDKSLSDEMRNNAIAERKKINEETRKLRQGNDLYDMFGFYPHTSWDNALVGLGTKGIGHLAHFFSKPGAEKKLSQPMTPEDEKALKEFKETEDVKKKRKIAKRIERNIVLNNLPL